MERTTMSHSSQRSTSELLKSLLGPRAASRLERIDALGALRGLSVSELRETYGLAPRAAL